MTADEMMTNKAYKGKLPGCVTGRRMRVPARSGQVGYIQGLMTTGDTYNSSQTLLAFRGSCSFRLADTWLAGYLRLEGGFGEAEYSQLSFSVAKANLQTGVRWLPFNSWVISPYLQTGLLYSIYASTGREMLVPTETYYADDYLLWGGLGLAGSLQACGAILRMASQFFWNMEDRSHFCRRARWSWAFRFGLTVGLGGIA